MRKAIGEDMSDKFILNDKGELIPCTDLMAWAQWFETSRHSRIVKQEVIGESKVSTVFLSIDHSWLDKDPILWETMVFGGPLDQEQDRCGGNREQAEAMHERMVEKVKSNL